MSRIHVGDKFGFLTAIEQAEYCYRYPIRRKQWLFRCDCGKEKVLLSSVVNRGATKSCGQCPQGRSLKGDHMRRHGMSGTREYASWDAMWRRCTKPNDCNYFRYGGRGITVCEEWKSIENFVRDMGPRPEGMTLDRWPDVNGNYEPGNCRWATVAQQN